MRNKVLITSVGRKVSLVKAFKDAGWWVIGHDTDRSAIALKFCDGFGDWTSNPDIWIPTRDAEIESAYEYNDWPTTHLDNCLDKFKFYEFCKKHGFKTPEVYFVKPRISRSGKETECVWQEFVGGEEISVDLFANLQGKVISVVPRKRLKVLNGESVITQTVKNKPLLQESIVLSNALGLIGHNCLQGFWRNGSMVWTDVNPRYGGASIVGIKAGCQSPEWLLKLINGDIVDTHIGLYKVGLTGSSYTEWTFEDETNP